MNRLSPESRAAVIASLVEGNSLRATSRMTGVALNTVTKLLTDMGIVCSIYQDRTLVNLPCERLEVDEIWSFCYAKQRNVPEEHRGERGYGDVWTFVGIDAETKLVPSYRLGAREVGDARIFMEDLAGRLTKRVQLTTDGAKMYLYAVKESFRGGIDYAQLIKVYGLDPEESDRRYSPPVVTSISANIVSGGPDPGLISTSYVERQNLTMRISMRRFTRLTNGFSKKMENLAAAVSLHFMHYNFCSVHKTLGTTPAVAAGVTDHVWTLAEMVRLLEAAENYPTKRGSYAKTRAKISD